MSFHPFRPSIHPGNRARFGSLYLLSLPSSFLSVPPPSPPLLSSSPCRIICLAIIYTHPAAPVHPSIPLSVPSPPLPDRATYNRHRSLAPSLHPSILFPSLSHKHTHTLAQQKPDTLPRSPAVCVYVDGHWQKKKAVISNRR